MNRYDFILIITLIILSLTPLLFNTGSNKKIAEIKLNGELFRQVDLSKDETFVIDIEGHSNVIKVNNNSIAIVEADCPDKICVKSGAISNVGEVIACVPHKILIEIKPK